MKIAVYGGSFNPPHVGHGMVAAWLLWTGRCDQVWLVPTYQHAFDKDLAPYPERVALCEAMAADVHPAVHTCTVEADLPVPSYTLDTLDALAARHPEHVFFLTVGADILEQVAHWRRWDLIQERYSPLVVGREGFPAVLNAPTFPDVSSTEIRHRLAEGLDIGGLVTGRVARLMALSSHWLPDGTSRT